MHIAISERSVLILAAFFKKLNSMKKRADQVQVRGAREINFKNIDVDIPSTF